MFKNIVFELVLFHREVILLESMYFMFHAIVQSMIGATIEYVRHSKVFF